MDSHDLLGRKSLESSGMDLQHYVYARSVHGGQLGQNLLARSGDVTDEPLRVKGERLDGSHPREDPCVPSRLGRLSLVMYRLRKCSKQSHESSLNCHLDEANPLVALADGAGPHSV